MADYMREKFTPVRSGASDAERDEIRRKAEEAIRKYQEETGLAPPEEAGIEEEYPEDFLMGATGAVRGGAKKILRSAGEAAARKGIRDRLGDMPPPTKQQQARDALHRDAPQGFYRGTTSDPVKKTEMGAGLGKDSKVRSWDPKKLEKIDETKERVHRARR